MGFLMSFWSGGREDDEFARRLWAAKNTWVNRPGNSITLDYLQGTPAPSSDARFLDFLEIKYDWRSEGLNTLKLEVDRQLPLRDFVQMPEAALQHTIVTVDGGRPA